MVLVFSPILRSGSSREKSIHRRFLFPVEVAAQDGFDDQMICGSGGANAYSDVDLPLGRNVQVRHRKDLLLLIVQRIKGTQPPVVRVVFDTTTDLAAEIITSLTAGEKPMPCLISGPCQVRSSAGFTAQYHRPMYLSTIGLISQVQVSGE